MCCLDHRKDSEMFFGYNLNIFYNQRTNQVVAKAAIDINEAV